MLIPFGVFSAGAGNGAAAGAYELISTTLISTNTSSITFDVTGLGATYKHLQFRTTARTNSGTSDDGIAMRFNSDTAANYTVHNLYGAGSSVSSEGAANLDRAYISIASGAGAAANIYSGSVIDLLDFASTVKFKTARSLAGLHATSRFIYLKSTLWRSTSAITTIQLLPDVGTAIVAGSRFSLYGIRG